jgi:hypothetical protein
MQTDKQQISFQSPVGDGKSTPKSEELDTALAKGGQRRRPASRSPVQGRRQSNLN